MSEKTQLRISLLLCFALFVALAVTAESMFDAGDGIQHYLISRYSWNHPGLFLHSWGKPFFTAISSPFSQVGFIGITLFNIGCGIGSAYVTYKIAKKLNYKNALLTIPFLLFAPVYFPAMNSGLTEPFFGLVLIVSIFLVIEKKYLAAALLVSFLPFVRSEGFILLPLFFVLLIFNRSFVAAICLFAGTLFYSFLGWLYWNDFFWVNNQNPYSNGQLYGTGSLWSFVERYDHIWGWLLGILFILGIICILGRLFPYENKPVERKGVSNFINVETVLILGCFLVYFSAHSYLWWKGIGNSMGLTRVLAGVMPCSALICLRGFNLVVPDILFRNPIVKASIFSVLLFFVILKPFQSEFNFPYNFTPEQKVIKQAGDWVKASNFADKKMYFLYPYLPLVLNVDPYDSTKVADLFSLYSTIRNKGISALPDSTIVIWDAHFGPNECGIPLERMLRDPNFDLLQSFYPEEPFKTLGEFPFSVRVFMKRNSPRADTVLKTASETRFVEVGETDLFNKDNEYGKTLSRKVSEFPTGVETILFNANLVSGDNEYATALVVLTVDDASGKNLFWVGKTLAMSSDSATTKTLSSEIPLSLDSFKPDHVVKVFVWNKDKKDFVLEGNKIICRKF